jgi:tetratricopeptide (TPR) repeat protein
MKTLIFSAVLCVLALQSQSAWYWPFGSDDEETRSSAPRLSTLMEPATSIIDDAADLAAEGKISEAVEKYREALGELDRIERENPGRVDKPEFSSLRNKRAYVNAAIDSLLMRQVQSNAKAVAVSDTRELERKFAEEKARSGKKPGKPADPAAARPASPEKRAAESLSRHKHFAHRAPANARERAMADIADGDYKAAEISIRQLLEQKPNSAVGLNLKAALEAAQGKLKEAERTLDQAIMSTPRDYRAYYNMSRLMLSLGERSPAKRYYETGRALGAPADAELEGSFK